MHRDLSGPPPGETPGTYIGKNILDASCRVLLDALDSGFCTVEVKFDDRGHPVDYRFLEVNAAFAQQTGLADAAGRWMKDMEPAHGQSWSDAYGRVALTGKPVRFEGHAAEMNRWFSVYAFPLGDPPAHTVAVLFNDITARKKAQQERDLSEKRLSLALDVAGMGLFDINLLTDEVEVNDRGREIYGWPPNVPLTFAKVQAYFHPDDKDRVMKDVQEALEPPGPREFRVEHRIIREDGAQRWIRVRGRALLEEGGKESSRRPVRCIGTYLDITEQKEESLRIEHYMKELEESNRRLDDFVYIVSHDLKEPVRGLTTFTDFLAEDYGEKLGPDGLEQLRTLKKLAARMEELIRDLLKYATTGKDKDAEEEFSLKDVTDSVLELMEPQLDGDGVRVTVQDNLPRLRCVRAHVAEILRNLIVNAVKYNDSKPKKIRIGALENHPKNPKGPVIFVRDNGIGIEEKNREAVFKMFKRLHGQDQYGGGTGSGLAIARKLAELHKGEIWAEPNPEGGSVFCFYVGGG